MNGEKAEQKEDKKRSKSTSPWKLRAHELLWTARYEFLKAEGYQLRPRYQPNASLRGKEERLVQELPNVMDAIRLSDGKKVCLKVMNPSETAQIREVSYRHRAAPGNRAVEVMDLIPIPDSEDTLAVMAYLRPFDDPEFQTLGEAVDAVDQFLEGLEFLHKHSIAHRDACRGNLMMDASELIPNGWHFAAPWTEDGTKRLKIVPRSGVKIQYFLVDFGLSVTVKDVANPTAVGIVGQDRTVPEFQAKDHKLVYDPFKLDIYQLGNAFRNRLLLRYDGLDGLDPLLKAMTQESPTDRPTASEARQKLATIIKDVDPKSTLSLKPGVRVWGPSPPRGRTNVLSRSIGSIGGWVSTKLAAIRKSLFK